MALIRDVPLAIAPDSPLSQCDNGLAGAIGQENKCTISRPLQRVEQYAPIKTGCVARLQEKQMYDRPLQRNEQYAPIRTGCVARLSAVATVEETGWFQATNVVATYGGVLTCRDTCYRLGWDMFGLECPHYDASEGRNEVHCLCSGNANCTKGLQRDKIRVLVYRVAK